MASDTVAHSLVGNTLTITITMDTTADQAAAKAARIAGTQTVAALQQDFAVRMDNRAITALSAHATAMVSPAPALAAQQAAFVAQLNAINAIRTVPVDPTV